MLQRLSILMNRVSDALSTVFHTCLKDYTELWKLSISGIFFYFLSIIMGLAVGKMQGICKKLQNVIHYEMPD